MCLLLFLLVSGCGYQLHRSVLPNYLIEVNDYELVYHNDIEVNEVESITTEVIGDYDEDDIVEASTSITWACDLWSYYLEVNFYVTNNSDVPINFKCASYANTLQYGGISADKDSKKLGPRTRRRYAQQIELFSEQLCPLSAKPKIKFSEHKGKVGVEFFDISQLTATRIDTIFKPTYVTKKRQCYSFLPSCNEQPVASLISGVDQTLILKDLGILPCYGSINTSGLNVRENPLVSDKALAKDQPIGHLDDKSTFQVLEVDPTPSYINNKLGYWMKIRYIDEVEEITGYVFSRNIDLKTNHSL